MYPVIDMNGSHPQPLEPVRGQRRKQRGRINSAAECNNQPDVGEARKQPGQARNEPLRAEGLRGYLSALSEKVPKEAIRSERATRNSSRDMASS